MSNPLFENVCLDCGLPLIELEPDAPFCSSCLRKRKKEILERVRAKDSRKGSAQRFRLYIPKLAKR